MSKAIQGVASFAGAAALGAAAFFDPQLVASPWFDKLMAGLVLSGVSAEAGAIADALTSNRGQGITTRQSNAYRTIVYGERQIPGSLVYSSTTASDHKTYNQIIALTGHEIDSILSSYLDGRRVFFEVGSVGNVTRNGVNFGGTADGNNHTGPDGLQYNFKGDGTVYLEARFGDQANGDVIGAATANDPNWAANSHGSPYLGGIAYLYLKLRYNASLFPQRPETRFVVRGYNQIWDPRDNTLKYTNNLALCLADVLLNPIWGLGISRDEIDVDALIAAANLADEQVPVQNTGGTEARYTCNYTCDMSTTPGDMLQAMLPAGAGYISYANGLWTIQLGSYVAPTLSFTKDDLTGPITLNPTQSYRDIANRVRGQYVAPFYPYSATDETGSNLYDSNGYWEGETANTFNLAWQPTSYPFYAQDPGHGFPSDPWLAEDGKIIYKDLNQSACISLATCQRLAKIELLRLRLQNVSATIQIRLGAYQLRAGDTFMLTVPELNWNNKVFEVTTPRFTPGYRGDDGKVVPFSYSLEIRETSPDIYTWNPATEEQTIYAVQAGNGGVPSMIDPPTGLTLTHTTVDFGLGSSGKGILISWTPSDDGYVTSTVIQYSTDGGSTWISGGTVPQSTFQSGIAPLPSGDYTVQIAAQRSNGAMSDWVSAEISFS